MSAASPSGRRLTERQAAVLAAVERLGLPIMRDLWAEFPDLQPSTIKRVLDSLERWGLVDHAGDERQLYVNGVHWWSTAITSTDYGADLARIVDALNAAGLGVDFSADPHEQHVTIFVPLVEVEADLQRMPSKPLERLRATIQRLQENGFSTRLAIAEITAGPEPMVLVKLTHSPL